jgi:topoisomerase-4 subunit B
MPQKFEYNFSDCPDLVPIMVAVCCQKNIPFSFSGVRNLKIKESNRIVAIITELKKLGFVLYEKDNEELYLLQSALNIEDGLDGLRYNKVIIATDADNDGMHIRMLLMTFFLQFFPDLVKKGHVYILQTPLFRVRNKKETLYCYSEEEKEKATAKLGANPEITRFKGLGEIDPSEFRGFIGKDIRLDRVTLRKEDAVADMLSFYMGKNTPERQDFIINNLNVEVE